MIKHIDNIRYNTAAAVKIVAWDTPARAGRDDGCAETLYRSVSGKFFIHGVGGAHSPYGRGRCPGEDIIPVSQDEAYHLVTLHSPDGQAEVLMAGLAGGAVKRSISLPAIVDQRLLQLQTVTGRRASQIIADAIMAYDP